VSVSVITPSLPERGKMLAQCIRSVQKQTVQPLEHLIAVDYERVGVVANTNRLAEIARGDWLLPLADDDYLRPRCIEKLLNAPGTGRVVYSEVKVEGEGWPPVGPGPSQGKPAGLPGTALIERSLWNELGGYRSIDKPEDLDLWTRATEAHAGFRYVPEVLWVYRLGHEFGNLSRGTLK
jgi:glycosyltransferase involved in cell wall biosynthesis